MRVLCVCVFFLTKNRKKKNDRVFSNYYARVHDPWKYHTVRTRLCKIITRAWFWKTNSRRRSKNSVRFTWIIGQNRIENGLIAAFVYYRLKLRFYTSQCAFYTIELKEKRNEKKIALKYACLSSFAPISAYASPRFLSSALLPPKFVCPFNDIIRAYNLI